MKVFQYVIMYTPNKEEKEKGEKAQFLSGTSDNPIVTLLAEDEKKAMLLANRAIPEKYIDRLDGVDLALRPF